MRRSVVSRTALLALLLLAACGGGGGAKTTGPPASSAAVPVGEWRAQADAACQPQNAAIRELDADLANAADPDDWAVRQTRAERVARAVADAFARLEALPPPDDVDTAALATRFVIAVRTDLAALRRVEELAQARADDEFDEAQQAESRLAPEVLMLAQRLGVQACADPLTLAPDATVQQLAAARAPLLAWWWCDRDGGVAPDDEAFLLAEVGRAVRFLAQDRNATLPLAYGPSSHDDQLGEIAQYLRFDACEEAAGVEALTAIAEGDVPP